MSESQQVAGRVGQVRRGVSPYASGGGGFTLERRVAAVYLARLMTGTSAAELGGRRVERVAFQQGPEHSVDDLVVSAAREDGADPLELAIAVRRAPLFVSSDQDTEKLVGTFVADLLRDDLKNKLERRLAICVAGPQPAAKQVGVLSAYSRPQATAEGFFRLVQTPGRFDRAVADRLGHLVALVTPGLTAIDADASRPAAEAVTWRLLSCLDIVMLRVEPPDETDWVGSLIDQLTPWAREPTLDAAAMLRDRLESLAAYAPAAADVDRRLLFRDARRAMHGERWREATVLGRYRSAASPRNVAWPAGHPAYLEQVRQIAPQNLRNREMELAELARFCTEPDQGPYTWWRAPAWSGKSALLSWFALHPPPGVRIVSFFVTARWSAQNDRAAFTDAVAEQLAYLLGEQVPASLTDATRYGNLLRLLRDATQVCQETSERLVLVVDGLDEDCGVDSPAGHSIAGLLPTRPPEGCRIVVASRPNPPLPADVPDDHPMRDRRIVRLLAISAHAVAVRGAMERELHLLLDGTSLEQDLLGLLLAAGGGLGSHDLAELTGSTEYQVTSRLRTVAGRSFTTRPARWHRDVDVVYVLGHEQLRITAAQALGPARIAEYREQVQRWADRYRGSNWPADTPEYLLDGYHHMLKSAGEITRMVDYATDRVRHDRMRDVSGGDSMALREISTSLDLLKNCPDPDIHAMARLAMHRDTIADRNRHIPEWLPGLWAELGQTSRAEALARSISSAYDRASALTYLAQALATAGHHDRALAAAKDALESIHAIPHDRYYQVSNSIQVAMQVSTVRVLRELGADDLASSALGTAETAAHADDGSGDAESRARTLVEVAQVLRESGDQDRALTLLDQARTFALARTVPWYSRGSALARVTQALAEAGCRDRALAAAGEAVDALEAIPHDWSKSVSESIYISVLVDVAKALERLGDRDRALSLLHQAETTARAIVAEGTRGGARTVADLACAWEALGDRRRALALLDRAEGVAGATVNWYERVRALSDFGRTLAEFGDHDRALKILGDAEALAVADRDAPDWRDSASWVAWALIDIAARLERSGDHRRALVVLGRAESVARSVADDQGQRASLLTGVARLLNRLDDRQRAAAVASEAEKLAALVTDSSRLAWTLAEVVPALATAGDRDKASAAAHQVGAIANSISNPYERESLLRLAARSLTVVGDHDRAEAFAYSIARPELRIHTVAEMACCLNSSGHGDRALTMARRAEALAESTSISFWELSALTSVVRALATVGEYGRAESIAHSITDPSEQATALAALVTPMIDAGELDRAEILAYSIPALDEGRAPVSADIDGELAACAMGQAAAKIEALSDLTRAMIAKGDRGRALAAFRAAEDLAGTHLGNSTAYDVLPAMARALVAIGAQDRAEALADTVADLDGKAEVLLSTAQEASPVEARRLVAAALALGRWTVSLGALASMAPHVVGAVSDEYQVLISSALATATQARSIDLIRREQDQRVARRTEQPFGHSAEASIDD